MKICMLSFHCCPFSPIGGDGVGGMSVYLKELSSVLTDNPDVAIDIFTRVQKPSIRGVRHLRSNLRVIHLKGGPEYPCDRKNLYEHLPEFAMNLEGFMLQEKDEYDLVYSHYWLSGVVGEWLKYRIDLPLVHTYHTLAFLKGRALGSHEHGERIEVERRLALNAEMIISTSAEEKESLIVETGTSPENIRVIYPGINKKMFFPSWDKKILSEIGCAENDRILLYVGRIEPVKGLMSVIEAIEILKNKNSDFSRRLKLIVIGGGEKNRDFEKNREVLRIERAVKSKSLEKNIMFLGSKKQDQLKKFYSAADALIVPSLYESFGLVVLEALACGTPILVSQIGKMKTIVEEGMNGFCFQPNKSEALATSIEYFYRHKHELWSAEKIRRDIIEKFSWEKTGKETFRSFEEFLKKRRMPTTIYQPGERPQPV